jgi:glycosyltransferase involved in cell wall biosynthesis
MAINPNVSIITACKNRVNSLKVSLSSWIQFDEVKEIIIVDWSSDEPINYLTKIDPRVKVIRVEDKKYFNQPQPLNLAALIATGEYIFKLDGDHMFNPYDNGIKDYMPNDKQFFCGEVKTKNNIQKWSEEKQVAYIDASQPIDDYKEYVTTYSPFYRYLFGMLMVKREHFYAVGGYNEKICDCYAYEDDEMYDRLCLFGLEKVKYSVNSRSFIHLPHGDDKRTKNFRGFEGQDEYKSAIHKKLSEFYSGDELKWQVEYALSEKQTELNKKMIGKIKSYRINNSTIWKITSIDDQNYTAVETKKDYKMCMVRYTSLEESSARRKVLENSFDKYNIKFKSYISKRYHESDDKFSGKYLESLNEGTKGCAASHLKMIKDWYENTDEDYGFFAEDDLSLETMEYWGFDWDTFISNTPKDADCIQLVQLVLFFQIQYHTLQSQSH